MRLRVVMRDQQLGPKFSRSVKRQGALVRSSIRATAREAAALMLVAGRASISAGGNFGSRWTDGLQANVSEGGGSIAITVAHKLGAKFGIFEHGGVIRGNPLLWFKPTPGFVVGDPEVISVKRVTIPQKFHVREECRKVAREIPDIYRRIKGESS